MTPTVIWTLVVIVFNGAQATSFTRDFPGSDGETTCKAAETAAHETAKIAIGVTDVGTKCLKSAFDPLVKPGA